MAEIEDVRSIRAHLTQEQLKNVYLFYGPETYLKDLYTRRIRDRLALDQMNCFFYGSDADPKEIAALGASVSMFGQQKLAVISGSGFFHSSVDTAFLEDAETAGIYLVFKEDEVDKRNKLYKKACECGIVFQCRRQPPGEIKKVLSHTVKAAGRTVSETALQYMIEGIGDDITTLLSEIEKLILYIPEGAQIEKEHVDALCSLHFSARLFDLNDAAAAGDTNRAYRIVQSLLAEKEPPVKMIAILSRMWSQLYSAKLLAAGGARTSEIAAHLGVKEFAAGKLVRQAAKLKFEKIREKIDLCEELDLSVKSGLLKDTDAITLLTVG